MAVLQLIALAYWWAQLGICVVASVYFGVTGDWLLAVVCLFVVISSAVILIRAHRGWRESA